MSRDREAVVWSRLATRPVRMGRLYITDVDCRFSYDLDYLATGLPGLGLIYPPNIIQDNTIIWQRSEFFDFLPPIQALIPPRGEKNFQRQLILSYLARKGITPQRGMDTDWEILKVAGHGAIGHLDVFESDDKALEWYSLTDKSELFEISDDLGFSLKEFLTWFDHDADALINAIGPTPSVGGAIPKLLLAIPETGWDNRIGLPTKIGSHGLTDVVLKFEQSAAYPGIIELEALALDIHRDAGFSTPRYWMSHINDIPILAVERFDRDQYHAPVFTETLYSVLASGDHSITHNYSYSYDDIANAIDKSPIDIVTHRQEAKLHLMKRLLLALLTGNGDLHMENLSLINQRNTTAFSPVYDPTPMRAYSIHNMLTVMPFGQYGEFIRGQDEPVGLVKALDRFASNLGIKSSQMQAMVAELFTATASYPDRIAALQSLPTSNKNHLINIVQDIRQKLAPLHQL